MPEVRGVPSSEGAAPRRDPSAKVPPAASGADNQSFKAHLEAKLAARRARKSVPASHLEELVRFFNRRGQAFESARLITKYPPIEKDDALYEVQTDTGRHQVIRSRDGSYTLFE